MKYLDCVNIYIGFLMGLMVSILVLGCAEYGSTTPCQVSPTYNGVIVLCEGQEPVLVKNGVDGTPGTPGAPGSPGVNGDPGTSIYAVELCSDVAPGFPEVGLCIDNKLYGLYATHSGFLTYFPSGDYDKNQIGCSLTINNCEVKE